MVLISTSIKYRRIWCVYLRAEEARVLMCHTNSISNNSFQLLRRYCTMRSLSPRKTIVDENRIITSSVFKRRHHFLRGFQTWLFRPSSCWKTPISSIFCIGRSTGRKYLAIKISLLIWCPNTHLLRNLNLILLVSQDPRRKSIYSGHMEPWKWPPHACWFWEIRDVWCICLMNYVDAWGKPMKHFFSAVYLIFRFIGGVWVVKRKCLHV